MLLMAGNYTDFNYLLAQIKSKQHEPKNYFMEASRFHWKPNDPEIVSDVLFAIANVISFARTTYLMPAFEVLGPLQISLGRMVGDITRFMVLFALVLFAFMVGLHNLYWYYGAQKFKMSLNGQSVYVHAAGAFQGLGHTFYSLFWSMFSQININEISVKTPDVEGLRQCILIDNDRNKIVCTEDATNKTTAELLASLWSTGTGKEPVEKSTAIVESVGMCLFGIYHVVIIIVLINMLIAMMSHSFEDIQ
ncbi:short transient receptor potential channel 7-like, partial [Octopus sinensis]|uniref:Short transient receptor potential channel 7-like n=1 Tax=Octopus sinensis TaxID=2607531 RepID=A0A6P7TZP4_9MOLL